MIRRIQRRFVAFTMLVIGSIIGFIILFFSIHATSVITQRRTLIFSLSMLGMVFLASILLSFLAIRPIRKAWQQQLDFTADASHELRTPLAVIRSNLEIVLENEEDTVRSQRKWLEHIQKEVLRMSGLVDDLLTLARADSQEISLEYTEVPLDLIIAERVSSFEAVARERQIQIEQHVEPELIMMGEVSRLTQLFTILLDNSVKYMGRAGTISITAYRESQKIQVLFEDNGIGIPAEETGNVFRRFYCLDKARTQNNGSSGLGLAIAQWIVGAHNGKIALKSDNDRGMHYRITFYLASSR